jgi:integrase
MASTPSRRAASLTQAIAERAICPPGKTELLIGDPTLPNFYARIRASGGRTWIIRYRTGRSRAAPKRLFTIGDVATVSLAEARRIARQKLGEVAGGGDPQAAARDEAKRSRLMLKPALESYEASLVTRRAVKTKGVLSLLRRELLAPLGNVALSELDRQTLAERVAAIERSGRPGTAKDFKTRATVFLGWAVGEGLISANPAAGWRRPRATRAERLPPTGRALSDHELPAFWQATTAGGPWFGTYLRLLLLVGTRRQETALVRWSDLDFEAGAWLIPAAVTKSGRPQKVALAPETVALLRAVPRTTSLLMFPGRGGAMMSGWTKRLVPVVRTAGLAPWTLHDLRRTFRSGLAALGVEHAVAELAIGHTLPGGTLVPLYDRAERWPERVEAAQRWARHVMDLVGETPPAEVVLMKGRAG